MAQPIMISMTRTSIARVLRVLAILFVPMVLSFAPVLMPLGDPYVTAKSAAKRYAESTSFVDLVIENWGYFFWYNIVGWGFLWYAITLWTGKLIGHKYSHAVWIVPTAFAFLIFLGAAGIIFPVPLGTYLLGAPCFIVQFTTLYLYAPSHWRKDWEKTKDLFRVFSFWLVWVTMLFTLSVITSLHQRVADTKFGGTVVEVILFFLPAAFDSVTEPLVDAIYNMNPSCGGMWWAWNSFAMRTYTMFVLAETSDASPIATFFVLQCELLEWRYVHSIVRACKKRRTSAELKKEKKLDTGNRSRMKNLSTQFSSFSEEVTNRSLDLQHKAQEFALLNYIIFEFGLGSCDKDDVITEYSRVILSILVNTCAPLHFSALLAFNHYSWNNDMFYVLDQFNTTEIHDMLKFLAVSSVLIFISGALKLAYLRKYLPGRHRGKMDKVLNMVFDDHWFNVILMCAGTTTVAGVCMVMKHDGMDVNFHFEWLHVGNVTVSGDFGGEL